MASSSEERQPLLNNDNNSNNEVTSENVTDSVTSCCSKVKYLITSLTVEPCVILFALSYSVAAVFETNITVDKLCQFHFQYSMNVCSHLDDGNYTEQQNKVQQMVSWYNIYHNFIEFTPAVFVVLMLGSWSDHRGKKLPLIVPAIGTFIRSVIMLLVSYFWTTPSWCILLSYIPSGITGGPMALFMASYNYISGISSYRSRTTRISFIPIGMLFAVPIGIALSTATFNAGGYVLIYIVQSAINLINILYLIIRIEEQLPLMHNPNNTRMSVLKTLSPAMCFAVLKVVTKRREPNIRKQIIAYSLISCLVMFSMGSTSFIFLYTRKMYDWDYNDFNIWCLVKMPVESLGSLLLLPLLSYKLQLKDSLIGGIGAAFNAGYYAILAAAVNPMMLYIAIVGMLFNVVFATARGALSKLVELDEIGAIFAVVAVGDSLVPLVSSSIFSIVYNATLDVYPGTIFVIPLIIFLVCTIMFGWLTTFTLPDRTKPDEVKVQRNIEGDDNGSNEENIEEARQVIDAPYT